MDYLEKGLKWLAIIGGIGCATAVACKAIDNGYSISGEHKDTKISLSKPSEKDDNKS